MATPTKFYCFTEDVAQKVHNLSADDLRVALTNTAPTQSQLTFDPVTNHPPPAAANGYPSGGGAVTVTGHAQSSGLFKLIGDDVVFTAAGGQIGPFRYAILYNNTAASDQLIQYWDYLSSVTLNDTETFTVDFDPTNGILQLQ